MPAVTGADAAESDSDYSDVDVRRAVRNSHEQNSGLNRTNERERYS